MKKNGTTITYSPDQLPNQVNLGTTKEEILSVLKNLLTPEFDPQILDTWANEILSQKITSDKVSEFVEDKKSSIEVGNIDTSAFEKKEKTKKTEEPSFVERVETPTPPSPQTKDEKEVQQNDKEDYEK